MNKNYYVKAKDIDTIYEELKQCIDNRSKAQETQRNLSNQTRNSYKNNSIKIRELGKKIGSYTNQINKLISELCKYNKSHKAMNLATSYLDKEIKRTQGIISKNTKLLREVSSHKSALVDSTGKVTYNCGPLKEQIASKKKALANLQKRYSYVSKHRA